MEDCPFCDEIETGQLTLPGKSFRRILFSTPSFCVVPALGPLTQGHLMILSKEHYIAVGQLPPDSLSELREIREMVRETLTCEYEAPLFFEHGSTLYRRKAAGCCIEHMHFAAIPSTADITPILQQDFEEHPTSDFTDLQRLFQVRTPYLYFENSKRRSSLFLAPHYVPSQYLRTLLSKAMHCSERADWRNPLGLEDVLATIERLNGRLYCP